MRNRFFFLLLNAPTESSKSHVEAVRHARTPPSFDILLVFDEKSHIKSKIHNTLGQMWTCLTEIYVHFPVPITLKLIWHSNFLIDFSSITPNILHTKSQLFVSFTCQYKGV